MSKEKINPESVQLACRALKLSELPRPPAQVKAGQEAVVFTPLGLDCESCIAVLSATTYDYLLPSTL